MNELWKQLKQYFFVGTEKSSLNIIVDDHMPFGLVKENIENLAHGMKFLPYYESLQNGWFRTMIQIHNEEYFMDFFSEKKDLPKEQNGQVEFKEFIRIHTKKDELYTDTVLMAVFNCSQTQNLRYNQGYKLKFINTSIQSIQIYGRILHKGMTLLQGECTHFSNHTSFPILLSSYHKDEVEFMNNSIIWHKDGSIELLKDIQKVDAFFREYNIAPSNIEKKFVTIDLQHSNDEYCQDEMSRSNAGFKILELFSKLIQDKEKLSKSLPNLKYKKNEFIPRPYNLVTELRQKFGEAFFQHFSEKSISEFGKKCQLHMDSEILVNSLFFGKVDLFQSGFENPIDVNTRAIRKQAQCYQIDFYIRNLKWKSPRRVYISNHENDKMKQENYIDFLSPNKSTQANIIVSEIDKKDGIFLKISSSKISNASDEVDVYGIVPDRNGGVTVIQTANHPNKFYRNLIMEHFSDDSIKVLASKGIKLPTITFNKEDNITIGNGNRTKFHKSTIAVTDTDINVLIGGILNHDISPDGEYSENGLPINMVVEKALQWFSNIIDEGPDFCLDCCNITDKKTYYLK